jgi:hypothetical protein
MNVFGIFSNVEFSESAMDCLVSLDQQFASATLSVGQVGAPLTMEQTSPVALLRHASYS